MYLEQVMSTIQCGKEKVIPKMYKYGSAFCRFAEQKLHNKAGNVSELSNSLAKVEKEIDNMEEQSILYQIWDMVAHLTKFYYARD